MNLTPEQAMEVIRRGNTARALLDNEDFLSVMNHLDTLHLSALVHCPPGEAHRLTRDHHHERLHALRDITDTVGSWASALDTYEERQSSPLDDDEDPE